MNATDATTEQVTNYATADVGPPDSKSARPTWKVNGQDDSNSNKEKLKAQIVGQLYRK